MLRVDGGQGASRVPRGIFVLGGGILNSAIFDALCHPGRVLLHCTRPAAQRSCTHAVWRRDADHGTPVVGC